MPVIKPFDELIIDRFRNEIRRLLITREDFAILTQIADSTTGYASMNASDELSNLLVNLSIRRPLTSFELTATLYKRRIPYVRPGVEVEELKDRNPLMAPVRLTVPVYVTESLSITYLAGVIYTFLHRGTIPSDEQFQANLKKYQ